MDWITTIANALTQLSVIKKERLAVLVILCLFVFGFWTQYSIIQDQKTSLKEHEQNCSNLIAKIREDDRISDNKRTELFQDQFDKAIVANNNKVDSIYSYFHKKMIEYNARINNIDKELNIIENENSN